MTGPVFIMIGGKERRLRYDINAAAEMEELMGGKSLLYVMASPMAAGFSAIHPFAVGWPEACGKRDHLATCGSDDAEEYMEAGGNFGELAAKIGEAVKASKIMGESLASEEDAPEETDEGNG